jgi:hypothetical protein
MAAEGGSCPAGSSDEVSSNHVDDRVHTAESVILLLENDVRPLRKRLAAEMVAHDAEAGLRERIRQLETENSRLIEEKRELTLQMESVHSLPGSRLVGGIMICCLRRLGLRIFVSYRSDQNMLQRFLAAASVGKMNCFLDELNYQVGCSCISCFAMKRRCVSLWNSFLFHFPLWI